MSKPKMNYFEIEDIIHLVFSDEPQFANRELAPNITAELNENGDIIGIEILNASKYIQETVLHSSSSIKSINLTTEEHH